MASSVGGSGATPNLTYYNGNDHGEYGYISLQDIVDNFIATYIGTGKILEGTFTGDVNYHAHRALQELSYDTLKSCKAISITLPPSLMMTVPNDYVNYTKITYADDNGIEHVLYPTSKTSAPDSIQQDADGNYMFDNTKGSVLTQNEWNLNITSFIDGSKTPAGYTFEYEPYNPYGVSPAGVYGPQYATKGTLVVGMEIYAPTIFPRDAKIASVTDDLTNNKYSFTVDKDAINTTKLGNGGSVLIKDYTSSTVWGKYKSSSGNSVSVDSSTTTNLAIDADNYFLNTGERYGLDPQHAQVNGSFFIDCKSGKIHFSSNLSGKQIVLHYISDGHGTDGEMIVPKLAEEAMYKWIAYGCLSAKADVPENIVQRFKREKFAETRKAKIRLSNIKIEEIAQIMRGKSKFIDH